MPVTKTIIFDQDVIEVLEHNMAVTPKDGKFHGVITRQLDRNLYVRVNKALDALGGTWNRKAKAHIFDENPVDGLVRIIATGTIEIDNWGWFPTPYEIVRHMVVSAMRGGRPLGRVLEPSAGEGSIVDQIATKYIPINDILCVELHPDRAEILEDKGYFVVQEDFLQLYPSHYSAYDTILMNPPFERGQDVRHVLHALNFLKTDGTLVAIMSAGVMFRSEHMYERFRFQVQSSGGTIEELQSGAFKESGTMTGAVMVTI